MSAYTNAYYSRMASVQRRRSRYVPWWQWLLLGAALFAVAVVTGPMADRHAYATSATFTVSILAVITSTVCWVVGFIRFAKWVWKMKSSS